MFGGLLFGGGTFGGGSLGTVPATFPEESTAVGIWLGGIDARQRVRRYGGPQIRDILNDAPNTCTFVVDGEAPQVGQRLRITLAYGTRVLFNGRVQTVDASYEAGRPALCVWNCSAIDDTAQANWRRPFGTWPDTSASTIATAITTTYASGISTAGIAAGLPTVSVTFDGSSTFINCLTQLAMLIGGYSKVEDGVAYLFLTDTSEAPDPIDSTHDFLNDPPITMSTDDSQLRTRVYGKGYGETIPADVSASDTLLPIEEGALFPSLGGTLIAGRTPSGAQSDRLTFTGVQPRGIGTLVGPGVSPAGRPTLGLQAGAGVDSGLHEVTVVYVTAAGKSLPGPPAQILVGTMAPPAVSVSAGPVTAGTGPDTGSHDYVVTYGALGGETVASAASLPVTTNAIVGQIAPPTAAPAFNIGTPGNLGADTYYEWAVTFVTAVGETTLGPVTFFSAVAATYPTGAYLDFYNIPVGPAGTTSRRLYRRQQPSLGVMSAWGLLTTLANNTTTTYTDNAASPGATAPPSTNTTGTAVQVIPVSNIPIGPSGTGTRQLYRRFNGTGSYWRVAIIADNTTTTYTDTRPNSAIVGGATPPSTGTAIGNQIALTNIPIGATAVTQREIYMTATTGAHPRRRCLVIADNTTTIGTITMSDATLAGQIAEPSSDTSGLAQPAGQVNAGATSLPVASAGAFFTTGGWVELGGGQVVRYTGIAGQSLTGIPASGAGSITGTVTYGSQAFPAPMLTGVSGVSAAILKGSGVSLWIQRDHLLAQAEQSARTGGYGIVEYLLSDSSLGLAALTARCDADLALFARPIVTVTYATHDVKSRSGKTVTINLASPAVSQTLTIQEVTISEIDYAVGLPPRFSVTASSVRFSLEDTLRQLIVKE